MNLLYSLGDWLRENPAIATVLIWPLFSAAVNAAFDYVKLHKSDSPLLQFVNAFFEKCGLDATGFVAFVRKLLGSLPPPGPPPGRGLFSNPPPYFPGSDPPPPAPPVMKKPGVYVISKGKKVWQGRDAVIWLLTIVLSLASFATAGVLVSGCGLLHAAVPTLEKVLTLAEDFELVLRAIEDLATVFFLAHPNEGEQAQFATLDRKAHEACDAAVRLADAGKDLDSEDVRAALLDMQAAYKDLSDFLSRTGIPAPHPASGNLGGPRTPYEQPLVMGLRLERKP